MIDLKDITYEPSIEECSAYIQNSVFETFYQTLIDEYNPVITVTYSKDVWLKGWNIKVKKAGKSLCVIYPKEGYIQILVVVGRKEKPIVESEFSTFTKELQEIYINREEGMGQRWLMIDIHHEDALYLDVLRLIQIRRSTK